MKPRESMTFGALFLDAILWLGSPDNHWGYA